MRSAFFRLLARLPLLAILSIAAGQQARGGQAAAGPPSAGSLAGQPIAAIRLIIEGRPVVDRDLLAVLETSAGATLSTAAVRESIVHLMALQRFEDARVSAEPAQQGDGVVLTFDLTPVRVVRGIQFTGPLGLPEGQLRAAVVDRYTRSPALARADEIARSLEALYHERGYRASRVTPRMQANGGNVTLFFDVDPGPRVRVGSIDLSGVPGGEEAKDLGSRLGLQVGAPFDRVAVLARADRLTEQLKGRGFLQASVEVDATYARDGRSADVAVRMTRGPRVTLVFRGDPLPPDRRDELVPVRREGAVDEDLLEDSRRRIEDYLRGLGYREATAPYTREPRGDDELLIVFTVNRGPQYKVAKIEFTGVSQVPLAELKAGLQLEEGQWFVKARLDADAAIIAEHYRRRGFRDVKVEPAVVAHATQQALLTARIAITEGPRTTIAETVFQGNQAIGTPALLGLIGSRAGRPFYQPQLVSDRDAVLTEYLNRGYQLASVEVERNLSADQGLVGIRFVIQEGPRILIDHVLVVGNERTSVSTIEREAGLSPGQPLSIADLSEAQRRLTALGLFRRVQVTELQHGSETHRDVLVVVEEGPVNTVGYGGGLEGTLRTKRDVATGNAVERFDLAPRGFFEIGRRNIGGKNRAVNLFARAAIRSSDQVNASRQAAAQAAGATAAAAATEAALEDPGSGFREYRVMGTYREPRFLGTPVDLTVTAVADQAIRSSFDFNRRQAYVEASHRFSRTLGFAARYALGRTRLFNERIAEEDKLVIDRLFKPGVRLSSFSASVSRDTRDDAFEPTQGTLLLVDATLAARRFGSEVGFARTYAQGFLFKQLPVLRGSVLAGGMRIGLAKGLPRLVHQVDEQGNPVQIRVEEIPAGERFFAGGDTTVRGFAQDKLGASETLDRNGVSNGGNAVLIFNGELRFPLLQRFGLGGAAFVDVGNVFARASDFDLTDLRSGAGFGIRWKSPVGPLRVDLGWKLSTITYGNGEREGRFAPYITIGQAF